MMFFRSLGGSIGMAGYGTVLNSTIRSGLPARLPGTTPAQAVKLIRTPADIRALPPEARRAVIDTIATGVSRIYWVAAITMLGAVAWAAFMPELPLRSKAGLSDAMTEPSLV